MALRQGIHGQGLGKKISIVVRLNALTTGLRRANVTSPLSIKHKGLKGEEFIFESLCFFKSGSAHVATGSRFSNREKYWHHMGLRLTRSTTT